MEFYILISALFGGYAMCGYLAGGGGPLSSLLVGALTFALWPAWPAFKIWDFFEEEARKSVRLHGKQKF